MHRMLCFSMGVDECVSTLFICVGKKSIYRKHILGLMKDDALSCEGAYVFIQTFVVAVKGSSSVALCVN